MVKCYKKKNLDSYYLEMGATEGFLKGEIKTLVDKLRDKEEEIKKLKSDLATVIDERDNAFKKIEQLKEDIDNGFNRETDLRSKRADSLLENKDLRDKIEELETDYDRLKVAFEDVVSGK